MVASFDDLEKNMISTSANEEIKIGVTVTVGTCLINKVIDRINEKKPNMQVKVYLNNTAVIEEKLLKGELDAALVEGSIRTRR